MRRPPYLTRITGFAIIISTILVVGVGLFFVHRDIDGMRKAAKENIFWSAVQLEIELLRFEHALSDFAAGVPGVTPVAINDRFDILWSRVSLFENGDVGERLRAYDAKKQAVAHLFAAMKANESRIATLKAADMRSALELHGRFEHFNRDIRDLSRNVSQGEERLRGAARNKLADDSLLLTIIASVSVVASLLMIFIFARETNRFRMLAQENRQLLEESKRASRAKSDFLAMISHELRTPLNGVLGMLALVQQQQVGKRQKRLLDQAERSGQQMIGLLADILDFSSLQDGKLVLEQKPFDPTDLATAVSDMFAPVATREGIRFRTETLPTCPQLLLGDFARLRQALVHLAAYLVETGGMNDILLTIGFDPTVGHLCATISFDWDQTRGDWTPDLIVGRDTQSPDRFATEALWPAIARGLIDEMGGTTKLDTQQGDRIAVLVMVPANEVISRKLTVRIICQSQTLETICKAALHNNEIEFVDGQSVDSPRVVLLQAGGEHETEIVGRITRRYPESILVALGQPVVADYFDDIVPVPIDVAEIRRARFLKMAKERRATPEKDILRAQNNGHSH